MEKLMGVREVVERTGLAKSWIYLRAEAGEIPHLKIGKYLKFRLSEIEAWLEGHRRGPAANGGKAGGSMKP